jgi:hypothetical protein
MVAVVVHACNKQIKIKNYMYLYLFSGFPHFFMAFNEKSSNNKASYKLQICISCYAFGYGVT